MSKIKKIYSLIVLSLVSFSYGQYTDQINSNRPGVSQSAFAVGEDVIQIETGAYGITEKHNLLNYTTNGYGIDAVIRYGFLSEKSELIADIKYQNDTYEQLYTKTQRSILRQSVLGFKYLIYDPLKNYTRKINTYSWKANQRFDLHQLIPAIAVFSGANYFTANNPYYFSPKGGFSPKVMLITQNQLGQDLSWGFVTNLIADYIGTTYPSYNYVITLTKGFNKSLVGFIENQSYNSKFYSDTIFRTGGAFLISNNFQIDISASASIKNTPSILYGGIGLSWRYTDNYVHITPPPVEAEQVKKN